VAWISVDELLEKIMLKLYKQWERRLLSQVRPSLDVGRLELANALRAMASAHVIQFEDAIILFLERLSMLEAVMAAAPEEFVMLPELKQSVLRARRPGMRLRGHKVKPTNLNPARMQTLLSMLEALDPPAYAVTRMFLPEDLVALATLLESVLLQVYANWSKLALETRGAILRILNMVRAQLTSEDGHRFVTVRSVVETLHQFESMPEVMQVSRDAFLAGKMDNAAESPFRFNEMVPVSERLAKMIASPPPVSANASPADPSLPAPELSPMPDVPGETPEGDQPGEQPAKEPMPAPDPGPVEPVGPSLPLYAQPQSNAVVERDFYTDVRFPQQVRLGDEAPLVVRLTRSPFALSRSGEKMKVAFGQPDQPEYVEVVVVAHGFGEATATWSRTMAVYVDRDSQPAIFLLQAQGELGEKRVTLDFYHKGRYLGSAAFVTRIVEQLPNAVAGVVIDTPGLAARFVEQPPPPADLELRIVRGSRDNVLYFMLHSTRAGVGYHWRPMGQVKLNSSSPQNYLQGIFANLGNLAAQNVDHLSEENALVAMGDIASIGQQLFKELFPAELQHELWTRILPKRRDASHPEGIISTLLITSDEPWIPWEMVKPYRVDPDTGMEQSTGYLCEMFQVTRWLSGRSPAHQVHIKQASIIAPQNDLPYAQREEAYFRQFAAYHVQVSGPLRSTADVRQVAQAGGVQLLHFAAHGRFDPENANLSPLSLQDGALTPFDFAGERAAGLRRERPLVFLNACHTARLAFALTGLGGWAERLIADLNVSAFIGTLWEVNDLLAAEFAIAFYERLLAGDTLGQAFYTARLHVRDRQPANPTWLAYVLYADPNSVVRWGTGDEEEAREPVVEEAPAPVEPPKPEIDPEELKAALEVYFANTLPDLVRRSISGVINQAVTRALGGEDVENSTEKPADETAESSAKAPTDEPTDQIDSMLFLSALVSSQADVNSSVPGSVPSTAPNPTPNGVHPHHEEPSSKESASEEPVQAKPSEDVSPDAEARDTDARNAEARNIEEKRETRRPRSSRRKADDNDSSPGGPRAQA
jgi:hypothetical protein